MFDHVTIRARDRETSERFYARVLRELEVEQTDAAARQQQKISAISIALIVDSLS